MSAQANLTRRRGDAEDVREVTIGGRLRFGGSTSSSTAGVLACQWNVAPLKISVQPGSRLSSPAEETSREVRKVRKVSIGNTLAVEASKISFAG